MTLTFAIAIYAIIWWIVLFAMLPIAVRTQEEEGEVACREHAQALRRGQPAAPGDRCAAGRFGRLDGVARRSR